MKHPSTAHRVELGQEEVTVAYLTPVARRRRPDDYRSDVQHHEYGCGVVSYPASLRHGELLDGDGEILRELKTECVLTSTFEKAMRHRRYDWSGL